MKKLSWMITIAELVLVAVFFYYVEPEDSTSPNIENINKNGDENQHTITPVSIFNEKYSEKIATADSLLNITIEEFKNAKANNCHIISEYPDLSNIYD
ncbi:hypothetical protein [Abyssalbus ytuae]|uniref:Uncharacterized protein n=1 Tax=Abyssalbus ytuae TaxID=2926907 RepID=A0A9E7CYI5_9FLAO|nr:hypothetical protein [Abyssalbus ytuae]UOB16690.1 hypothetical protein MQE35_13200 [Abyssalbus ytuae]